MQKHFNLILLNRMAVRKTAHEPPLFSDNFDKNQEDSDVDSSDNASGQTSDDDEDREGPDTFEQFKEDDLIFRTLTTLIQKLSASTRKQTEFNLMSYEVSRNTKALSKFSFLMVRDAEVVASSPIGKNGIAVTHSPTTECVFSRNPRNKDNPPSDQHGELWIVGPGEVLFDMKELSENELLIHYWYGFTISTTIDSLANHLRSLSWENHVHFYALLVQKHLEGLRKKDPAEVARTKYNLVSYTHISTVAKNYRRLCLRKCSRTRNFFDTWIDEKVTCGLKSEKELRNDLDLPYGTGLCLSSFLNRNDRIILLKHAPQLLQFPNVRYHLYTLLEDEHCNTPLDETLFLSTMVALWELLVGLLKKFQQSSLFIMKNYPIGGEKVPDESTLDPLKEDIIRVHAVMDHLLFSSKFLGWFLKKIVSKHLLPLTTPTFFVEHNPSLDGDATSGPSLADDATSDEDLEDMDVFQDEKSSYIFDEALQKVWDWLRLSFCPLHYLNAFLKECLKRPNGALRVMVVATPRSDSLLKDWKEVVVKIFPNDFETLPSTSAPTSPTGLSPPSMERQGVTGLSVLETLHGQGAKEKARNGGKLSWLSFLSNSKRLLFLGCRHAEALLATIILLQHRPDLDEGVSTVLFLILPVVR